MRHLTQNTTIWKAWVDPLRLKNTFFGPFEREEFKTGYNRLGTHKKVGKGSLDHFISGILSYSGQNMNELIIWVTKSSNTYPAFHPIFIFYEQIEKTQLLGLNSFIPSYTGLKLFGLSFHKFTGCFREAQTVFRALWMKAGSGQVVKSQITSAIRTRRGSSQFLLHSTWLSKNVRTAAVAFSAPFTLDRIKPAE